ncbi:hypothetical protein HAX54_012737, partial [Datura stramonium]|nr:hypothetical protein [Datura stramonium]
MSASKEDKSTSAGEQGIGLLSEPLLRGKRGVSSLLDDPGKPPNDDATNKPNSHLFGGGRMTRGTMNGVLSWDEGDLGLSRQTWIDAGQDLVEHLLEKGKTLLDCGQERERVMGNDEGKRGDIAMGGNRR